MTDLSFEVTAEHVSLLQQMRVSWDGCEFGAPSIDPKRPYGNGDVVMDIARILGWDVFMAAGGERFLTPEQDARARELHTQMETVLQIFLRCATLAPGHFVAREYFDDWRPA